MFYTKILLALHSLLDYISPPFCSACNIYLQNRAIFCVNCERRIVPIVSKTIAITATKQIKVFAISQYEYPIKRLILAKHGSNQIASQQLGELLWEKTDICNIQFDIIVPIPLHWTRYASRGFNQSDEIAKAIAKKSNKPTVQLLKRVRRTKFQAQLDPIGREKNVLEVFDFYQTNLVIKGKHILLVDDLLTTGATIKSAAKKLFQLHPASITIAVACRTS